MQSERSHLNGNTVSNDLDEDEPLPGRKRVSRACARCRAKKDKCDGLRPACSACHATGQLCSYETATKKRGLPEGYVRGLEKLWALCIGKIAGLEDAVVGVTGDQQAKVALVWESEVVGEELHAAWKDSRILAELEKLLSNADKFGRPGAKRKHDEDHNDELTMGTTKAFHQRTEYEVHTIGAEQVWPSKRQRTLPVQDAPLEASLPQETPRYMEHYFAYTHCWLPILDRAQLLRSFYQLSRNKDADGSSRASLALLWALCAYTVKQMQNVPMLDALPVPSTSVDAASISMRASALRLLAEETSQNCLIHIQAIILLALLDIGNNDWCDAWILSGRVVRLALRSSLKDQSSERCSPTVLQACFILDTLVAAHLSLPPHLRRSDLEHVGFSEEDGREEWEPWPGSASSPSQQHEPAFIFSTFNRLFEILVVVNDALTCPRAPGSARTLYFEDLEAKLLEIQQRFPAGMAPIVHMSPHLVYLRLFHYSTSIIISKELSQSGSPTVSLARSACAVLSTLTGYVHSGIMGLDKLPPVLENPVRAACYSAIASRPIFDTMPELPAYIDFARNMTNLTMQLSLKWPVFSGLTSLWHKLLHHSEARPTSATNAFTDDNWRETFPFLRPGTFETAFPSTTTPHIGTGSSEARDARGQDHRAVGQFDVWANTVPEAQSFAYQDLHTHPAPFTPSVGLFPTSSTQHQSDSGMNLGVVDSLMSGIEHTSPPGTAVGTIHSSPSYPGDDVDAIFHNLAHLDANEWTDTGAGAFKDFGFTDDLTFQAFCDDPERLVSSSQPQGQYDDQGPDFWHPDAVAHFPANHNARLSSGSSDWWS